MASLSIAMLRLGELERERAVTQRALWKDVVTVSVLPPQLSPKGHSGNVRAQEIHKVLLEQGPGSPGCVGRLGQSISAARPLHPSIHPSTTSEHKAGGSVRQEALSAWCFPGS